MRIEFPDKFSCDLDKIHHKSVKKSTLKIIEQLERATSFSEISTIKKLTGFRSAYRIRIGDYRIGILVEGNVI